jgi:hypothetical protein
LLRLPSGRPAGLPDCPEIQAGAVVRERGISQPLSLQTRRPKSNTHINASTIIFVPIPHSTYAPLERRWQHDAARRDAEIKLTSTYPRNSSTILPRPCNDPRPQEHHQLPACASLLYRIGYWLGRVFGYLTVRAPSPTPNRPQWLLHRALQQLPAF